jgi:flagellar protein FlaF
MKTAQEYVSRPQSGDPREVEAWALTEAARRIVAATRDPDNQSALRDALLLNQRLWTIFQVSMAEPDCPLPDDLRRNIFALSVIVDRQTTLRLVDLDAAKLDLLLDINRQVAAGLRERPQSAAPAPKPAAAPDPAAQRSIAISA